MTSSGMEELWPRIPDIRPQYFAQGYIKKRSKIMSLILFFACKILSEPDACKGEGGIGRPAEEEDSDQSKHLQVIESREKYFLRLSEKLFENWCYEKLNEYICNFYIKFCFE